MCSTLPDARALCTMPYFHTGVGVAKNKISGVWIMLDSQMRHQINCETCGQFSSQNNP